jgi:hypothetical protein
MDELNQALQVAISTGTTTVALDSSLKPSVNKLHLVRGSKLDTVSIPRSAAPKDLSTSIGTGNVAESTADLWREMEVLIKAGGDAAKVLQTCTSNPAQTLGLKKGSLDAGMDADFILFKHDKSLKQLMLTAPVQTPLIASFAGGFPLWMESDFEQKWQSANIAVYAVTGAAPVDMAVSCEFDSIESALVDFGNLSTPTYLL